jgi:hypothetical protein
MGSDARAKQAMYMAKKSERTGSVRGGIWRAALLIGLPIIAAVVVTWWLLT